jgi:hypothetical protein
MRPDSLGMWWRDEPPVKKTKEVKKCVPPEPVWLRDDYLPGIEEAKAFNVPLMSDHDLWVAYQEKHKLLFDVEVYWNYFCVSFASYTTGKVIYFEITDLTLTGASLEEKDKTKLFWILENFTIVSFNGNNYDLPMLALALAGKTTEEIKKATNQIIIEEWRASDVLKMAKVRPLKELDHIDLIEVAPLQGSLKTYGGRLHTPRMQDLPFHPEKHLTLQQMAIVRYYNVNDLTHTGFLLAALKEQIELREVMGRETGLDLRSKSDAQMAEAVIAHQLHQMTGKRPVKPEIEIGTTYHYRIPHFIRFESPLMRWALDVIRQAPFVVAFHGSIDMPETVAALHLKIGGNVYRMGIGGLHSSEKNVVYRAGTDYVIEDRDVTSYYPQIIINQGLYPVHLGPAFLKKYSEITLRRISAKSGGQKEIADSLKIVVNGTFGKLGSKWSIFYSPDLLIQVTITGQLALLMLIERLELAGISIISANTDGVVIKCPRELKPTMATIVKQWEIETGFQTEDTHYSGYYARDVNNYIAVKLPDKKTGKVGIKSKGAYANPWNDPKLAYFRMHKNPVTTVCLDAVEDLLAHFKPIEETIRSCKDIRRFVSVRKVKGGAVKNGQYLGSVIRWYYAEGESGEIIYASSGKKVPKSDGAKPLMQLPDRLPEDINYSYYIEETERILRDIGYSA